VKSVFLGLQLQVLSFKYQQGRARTCLFGFLAQLSENFPRHASSMGLNVSGAAMSVAAII